MDIDIDMRHRIIPFYLGDEPAHEFFCWGIHRQHAVDREVALQLAWTHEKSDGRPAGRTDK